MTQVACELKLRSVVMPRKLGGNQACIVYHARAAHLLSAGIRCRHCSYDLAANDRKVNNKTKFHNHQQFAVEMRFISSMAIHI